jgi:hypothetical protein
VSVRSEKLRSCTSRDSVGWCPALMMQAEEEEDVPLMRSKGKASGASRFPAAKATQVRTP